MSIRISDPLFLLSAQTGLSATDLIAEPAEGNTEFDTPQAALQTGEPIPVVFCRRRSDNGGVMIKPKMTEAFFSNDIDSRVTSTDGGTVTSAQIFEVIDIKYLLVLSEGNLPQLQVRDLFFGTCRKGTFNQKYDGRAGTWSPGNNIDDYIDYTVAPNAQDQYIFDVTTLNVGETAKINKKLYHAFSISGTTAYPNIPYKDHQLPIFTGTSGSYSGLSTLSFEYQITDVEDQDLRKSINVFVRNGLQVTRLTDGVTAESDNFVDLVKYLFQSSNRLADDLIDNTALGIAANFVDTNGFLFNGSIAESQNLLDWVQKTSVNFLLRASNTNGKFGLRPRLPYNTDNTIKTTQITPQYTFTEDHIVEDGFEIEYISLEDREPSCFVVQWRQQPEADFGLVRTVEVRYENEAVDGPFINIDVSNYCTNEDHAVKIGAFRLAQRKFITHHLRITVRELNYNSLLTVGDLVRVRLRRETSEGEVEYHDKVYEINRIEKTFTSTIVYDLTHFPIDSEGRSIVAREVAAASGAGNDIDVGRNTFDCDENSDTDTTPVGTDFGGGGTVPGDADTSVDLDIGNLVDDNGDPILGPDGNQLPIEDAPYPGDNNINDGNDWNNPDDSIEGNVSGDPQITGYTGNPQPGDELSFAPGCADAFIEWYSQDKTTGELTLIGSGIGATLLVTAAMLDPNQHVIGIGRCPDPSSPDDYGTPIESDPVDWLPECIGSVGGCQYVNGIADLQIQYDGSNGWVQPFGPGSNRYTAATNAVQIKSTSVFYGQQSGKWIAYVNWSYLDNGVLATTDTTDIRFTDEADARSVQFRLNPKNGATCIQDCST